MSELSFSFKDIGGSIELVQRGQIVYVYLAGSCGDDVMQFYSEKLRLMADSYAGQPWAYFCDSKEFLATTPQGQQNVIDNYGYCMQAGCRFDAYRYDSPLGIAQTIEAMRANGNNTPIDKVLFEDKELAIEYLNKQLVKFKQKTAETLNR